MKEDYLVMMSEQWDKERLGILLHTWRNCFGDAKHSLTEAMEDPRLAEVIKEIAGDKLYITTRGRLAMWVGLRVGQQIDGYCFVKKPRYKWAVVKAEAL